MVVITEELIRKRAEHNNLEISTLEEVSLHQQDIEKIENIDKWCRDLKILYLQSNLIPKIENVGRLKKLEYLNLALNNIELIENLEACESLKKLDLTVNFVGELTSIECLRDLEHFEELYLTGNPCVDYDGYRQYVVATLTRLKQLDGTEIEKSERIKAVQDYENVKAKILKQQEHYKKKRMQQKEEAMEKSKQKAKSADKDAVLKEFQEEATAYTPESRIEMHEQMKELKKREEGDKKEEPKAPRRLFGDDGKVLNVNEPKFDFKFEEDEEKNAIIFEVALWKHLDTSLIDLDVQPNYVRLTVKGKIMQLQLPDEVKPDSSKAERSQITGALVVTMPKLHGEPKKKTPMKPQQPSKQDSTGSSNYLEFDSNSKRVDITKIVDDEKGAAKRKTPLKSKPSENDQVEQELPVDFVDDLEVPPLI